MIKVERLHFKLDEKLNKLASNTHQWISQEQKDFALNEAQIKLIKQKVGKNNNYGMGFDSFRKRYQDLEFLVVPHEELSATKTKEPISIYSAELNLLKKKFFLPVAIYTLAERDRCKDRIVVVEQIARHSDVDVLLTGTDTNPSFEYQVTFAVISSGQLRVYTEQSPKSFKVNKVYISYLRYPLPICFGDYEDFDGNIQVKQDCEFPELVEDELIEIAVEDLALSTENSAAVQAAQIRKKESE